jgi:glycosyltransferase involved in cell wall biosynthesis
MLFSIITPSYKQLDWLRLAIASLRDQVEGSCVDASKGERASPKLSVEHIIQDAGSPGIEDFAREVGATFYREGVLVSESSSPSSNYSLTIHSERDEGMYDAINRGLAKSTGEICAWLNSDEQYLEGTIEKVADFFHKDPHLDVLLGDAILVDAQVQPICYRRIMVPSIWHIRMHHLHSLSCAMFFRRRALPPQFLDSSWRIIGDLILMDDFITSKRKIRAISLPLSVYAFTGENLSANRNHGEHKRWLEMQGRRYPKVLKRMVSIVHYIRRLWHGSYGTHKTDMGVFTLKSPHQRVRFSTLLSGKWPTIVRNDL